ncbi:protein-glutamate O-methyltransferase CheR [Paenibacillus turicensis]|uniref:CheR family methyltransferase n=1 Tax=Paenibacillus turicensis TaxID=160487 RepID=UPI003D26884C
MTAEEFSKLAQFIQATYGIYLKQEKKVMLKSRLDQLLAKKHISSYSEYFDYVKNDQTGRAASVLVDKITTNHTYFMREVEHFHFLRDQVVPMLARSIKDRDLRIWSAGCSTGEEPYTLAMILMDYFAGQHHGWDTKVLATDISSRVLQVAQQGQYQSEQLGKLPQHWKDNYFVKMDEDHYVVDKKLRAEVIFRKLNLMDDGFPFKRKFHIIFCRNVMIYFDHRTRQNLIQKFTNLLEPGGYLFIGFSETLDKRETSLKYIMPAVYRKV